MVDYGTSQQEPDELTTDQLDTEDIAIADTGAGLLVFERKHYEHPGDETEITRRLIGFANVTDRDVIIDAARTRGHDDVLHLPEFEIDENVLMSFQAINRVSSKEGDENE